MACPRAQESLNSYEAIFLGSGQDASTHKTAWSIASSALILRLLSAVRTTEITKQIIFAMVSYPDKTLLS